MSKGRDFRPPRRRGFDDNAFMPDASPDFRPSRTHGDVNQAAPAADGPAVAAVVKWFNGEKGFGFVELTDGGGDAFLHIAVLQAAGSQSVTPGTKLRVNVGQGPKGRQITRVIDIDASSATATVRAPASSGPRGQRSAPDPASAVAMSGKVKWFSSEKGFGFVAADDNGRDVFVHVSVLERAGQKTLAEGQTVAMRVVETPKGREAISIDPAA
jgi:CspA family cold shock protein